MASSTSPPPSSTGTPSIIPAQLGFLAIYNPSLGTTDETIDDQIVYYASVDHQSKTQSHQSGQQSRRLRRGGAPRGRPTSSLPKEERNERLRSIGLAQGMVEFGRSFSGGRPVDSIDTEKSRVVLHELEPGWWILASVDLTRLPVAATNGGGTGAVEGKGKEKGEQGQPEVEYSSREVKPAGLLLRDLLRAHSVFLLHHDSSLSALFVRTQRDKFVSILGRYWDMFLASWNVMLHGNPACDMFAGIKIAASGELGFGVGEEERGSGEREVLEGLVGGVEGLVDLVVGKFGEAELDGDRRKSTGGGEEPEPSWLGTGGDPGAEDGAIFLGVGALSRHSIRAITYWMEDMYTWGENAYGVLESPTATRARPKRKKKAVVDKKPLVYQPPPPGLPAHVPPGTGLSGPPPPVTARDIRKKSVSAGDAKSIAGSAGGGEEGDAGVGKLFSYLKLGYGTSWTLGSSPGHLEQQDSSQEGESKLSRADESRSRRNSVDTGTGQFLIGLVGDFEENTSTPSDSDETRGQNIAAESPPSSDLNTRNRLRTIMVELENEAEQRPDQISKDLGSQETELAIQKSGDNSTKGGLFSDTASPAFDSQDRNKTKKLRVVVYAHRPFIFVLLFQLHTDSLAFDGLYRSLHHQLAPLHKGLLASTAYRPGKPENVTSAAVAAQIYDLIWDPRNLTVHSTIPSIPEPGPRVAGPGFVWSRIEALNTHSQILNIFVSSRDDVTGFERTCKTSRGWWIVWNRVLEEKKKKGKEEVVVEGREDNGSESSFDAGTGDGVSNSEVGERQSDEEGEDELGDWGGDELDLQKMRGRGGVRSGKKKEMIVSKEIFLIRKASDHPSGGIGSGGVGGMLRGVSASYGSSPGGGSGGSGSGAGGWADGASRLAQGIGVDTKRYIEGLLSLNR
ncbi:hypothetical protein V8F20_005711 [Naviculisporaceae sp. PSN 640]